MVDTILQFLTWAIPSGGIGAAIAWIANRKVKQAESAKQIHDTYKTMYQDISKEWVDTQEKLEKSAKEYAKAIEDSNKENARTRNALNRLSRAIEAIQLCPHRASCPVSGELRNQEEGDADLAGTADGTERKSRQQRRQRHDPDEKPGDGQPDGSADMGTDVAHRTSGQRRIPHRGKGSEDGDEKLKQRMPG